MNAHFAPTGLGAAIDPAVLDFPIEFYAVAKHLHYRHTASGRVFRLRLDLAEIQAENESEDDTIDEDKINASARIEECPPDVISHAGAVPIADWQLAAYMEDEDLTDLVRDLADEADAHVVACPLAEPAPIKVEPVLQMTAEVVLSTLADLGKATCHEVAATLKARGVIVMRGAAAALAYLADQGLAETRGPVWAPTAAGKEQAAKIKAGLVALAQD